MGCAQSKRVEATAAADVYRPVPTSISFFDITSIEEPWLRSNNCHHEQPAKPSHLPTQILEKLDTLEDDAAPRSWSELSKALSDLKSTPPAPPPPPPVTATPPPPPANLSYPPKRNLSFHTLEELDSHLTKKPTTTTTTTTTAATIAAVAGSGGEGGVQPLPLATDLILPVRENSFIVRDRMARMGRGSIEEERRPRGPLSGLEEKCPPGGSEAVVLYTTTLRGVRKTFEDCEKVRAIMETERVAVDERDVSLHGGFLVELRGLIGEGLAVPRLFVKGRYVGGAKEVIEFSESGRLAEIFEAAGVRRRFGRRMCEGCGGARFVPCLKCSGSCKVVAKGGDGKELVRCDACNENGLVQCPVCRP